MKNVIISEKRDKKAAQFLTKTVPLAAARRSHVQVPHQYSSVAQYEQAMRTPLGPDWNTERSHGQLVKRDLITRKGQVITPMNKQRKAPASKKRKT